MTADAAIQHRFETLHSNFYLAQMLGIEPLKASADLQAKTALRLQTALSLHSSPSSTHHTKI